MSEEAFGFIVATAIVIIPALAFTARFAIVPLIESMRRHRGTVPEALEQRLLALEAEVRDLRDENATVRDEVRTLTKTEAFYRELLQPRESSIEG